MASSSATYSPRWRAGEVVEDPGVRDDRVSPSGELADVLGEVGHGIADAHVGWCGAGDLDGRPQPIEPIGLVGPDAGLEPARRRLVVQRHRSRIDPAGHGDGRQRVRDRHVAAGPARQQHGRRRANLAARLVAVLVAVEQEIEPGTGADVEVGQRADLGGDEAERRQQQRGSARSRWSACGGCAAALAARRLGACTVRAAPASGRRGPGRQSGWGSGGPRARRDRRRRRPAAARARRRTAALAGAGSAVPPAAAPPAPGRRRCRPRGGRTAALGRRRCGRTRRT